MYDIVSFHNFKIKTEGIYLEIHKEELFCEVLVSDKKFKKEFS